MRNRLAIALVCAAAAGATLTGPAAPAAQAKTPPHFYGIVSTLSSSADAKRMKRAHVGSIRSSFTWPSIQPNRHGPFNWAFADTEVALAARKHISVLPILSDMPTYEAHGCSSTFCVRHIRFGKRQRRDWKAFVRAAVKRYGRHGAFWRANPGLPATPIERWQIWNEENNPKQHNSPGVYAKLLAVSDKAISSVDRHGKVVTGGMPGVTHGGTNTTAWRYLAALYRHHARAHIGAVALHPYSPSISGIGKQLKKIRRVLKSHHAGSTPTLVTEIGWGSGGKKHHHGGTGSRGQAFVVGPKGQRKKLVASFKLLAHHRKAWRIGGVYWYQWKDPTNPPKGLCAFCYSSGLYKADGKTAKPALHAYRRLAR